MRIRNQYYCANSVRKLVNRKRQARKVVFVTWTISLTPGVRRRVAPMRVVMASWMDSREYTFLMNPTV
jgi:hypothetical protein